jgi:hypothetical protein
MRHACLCVSGAGVAICWGRVHVPVGLRLPGVDGAEVVRALMMQRSQCRAARCSQSVSVGHGARWSRQCFSASINSVFHCPPPLRLASRPRCASLVHVTFYAACHSRNAERRGERYDRSPCPAPRTRMV